MIKIARFEKIPTEQFVIDGGGDINDVILPTRATVGSAGYDFFAPTELTIKAGEKLTVASGIRCALNGGYFLAIMPKSGLGCKYQLGLANTIGIIDSDYYGAKNFGHILVTLVNNGTETVVIGKGKAFVQGIIIPFATADDDAADGIRTGGHGSTNS